MGTLGSKYEFFHEWKRLLEEEQGSGKSYSAENMVRLLPTASRIGFTGTPLLSSELSISGYRQRIYEYVYTRYKDAA